MSPHEILRQVMYHIGKYNPASILEIGCGYGPYGYLCRYFFDFCFGRYKQADYSVVIDGIEVFEDYVQDWHRYIYDNVFIGDAFDVIDNLGDYDVIVIVEVIEHFEKEQGYKFIDKCLEHTEHIILTTPYPDHWTEQKVVFGNEHERHLSKWTPEDFDRYNSEIVHIVPSFLVDIQSAYSGRIGIGIVSYHGLDLLMTTINSFIETTTVDYELVVFDNSLPDSETRRWLDQQNIHVMHYEDYNFELPEGWTNPGCCFGRNRLIEYFLGKGYEFILLPDSDIEFQEGCVEAMLKAMLRHSDVGYVGCPQANMGFAVNDRGYTEELANMCSMSRAQMWREIGLYPECLMYYSGDSWHSTLANMYGWKTLQLDKDYYIHHEHGSQSEQGVSEQAERDCKKWVETEAKWELYWRKRIEKGKGKLYS